MSRLCVVVVSLLWLVACRGDPTSSRDWERTCTRDGWCWETPRPLFTTYTAVANAFDGDVWLAGENGILLRGRMGGFSLVPSGVTSKVYAFSSLSRDVAFAATNQGEVLRWDGKAWTTVFTMPETTWLSVWASAPDDVWLSGYGRILHSDGGTFTEVPHPLQGTSHRIRLWGAGASDVWAVADEGHILHWDGKAWAAVPSGTSADLHHVWGADARNVWVTGAGSLMLRWDGTAWRPTDVSGDANFGAISGTSASDVWVTGGGGLYHWDGRTWTPPEYGVSSPDVVVVTGREGWAAGRDGYLQHLEGGQWYTLQYYPGENYGALWGQRKDDVWLSHFALVRFDGRDFVEHPGPSRPIVWSPGAIFGLSSRDVWVADGNDLVHWDGGGWTTHPQAGGHAWVAIWGAASDDVWASGHTQGFVHWNGREWTPVTLPGNGIIRDFWGTSTSDVWAVGLSRTGAEMDIFHYDGRTWTRQDLGGRLGEARAVHGTSPTDVWVVGANAQLLHFDGMRWAVVDTGSTAQLSDLWADAPDRVYAAGERGTLLRFDGASWTREDTASAQGLYAIRRIEDELWVLSGGRAVLRKKL